MSRPLDSAYPYEDYDPSVCDFQDPGGNSSLRRATRNNPRNLPCPTCHEPDRLTPTDVRNHYQCDECADRAEGLINY